MVVGTVKWFNTKKGFGFIVNPEGHDVFVHFSAIVAEGFRSLKQGQKVKYLQIDGPRGLTATQVERIQAPAKKPPLRRPALSKAENTIYVGLARSLRSTFAR
jgi:cold shock protein